jgi:cell fate (sporulation/competence/biofilm development) regulator YlbF (YheA/YmcA/DUF963 family)|tara:strand:+ start:14671 stop:15117 length:447 start_codon:yes stop_codon:yes gene_type:complete
MKDSIFAIFKKVSGFDSSKKVSLAASDELESAINEAETYSDVIDLDGAINGSKQLIQAYEDFKLQAETYYNEFENVDNWYTTLEDKRIALEDKLNSYEALADELGIDPKTSDSYVYGDELLFMLNEEYTKYNEYYNDINDAYTISSEN